MDNLKTSNKMTIKINGQKRPFEEGNLPVDPQTAAAAEQKEDGFDWVLPEEQVQAEKETQPKREPSLLSKGSGTFKRPAILQKTHLAAVVCAVLVGTSLGFMALKTLTATTTAPAAPVSSTLPAEKGELKPSGEKQAAASASAPLTAYLVQGGIFSTKEAAEAVQKEDLAKGIPGTILSLDGQFALFIGAAGSLEECKELAVFLKTYDVDVYWKEVKMEASAGKQEAAVFNELHQVYGQLAAAVSAEQLGKTPDTDAAKIKAVMAGLQKKIQSADSKLLTEAGASLTEAAALLAGSEASKDDENLLQAQGKLLHYITLSHSLAGS